MPRTPIYSINPFDHDRLTVTFACGHADHYVMLSAKDLETIDCKQCIEWNNRQLARKGASK